MLIEAAKNQIPARMLKSGMTQTNTQRMAITRANPQTSTNGVSVHALASNRSEYEGCRSSKKPLMRPLHWVEYKQMESLS